MQYPLGNKPTWLLNLAIFPPLRLLGPTRLSGRIEYSHEIIVLSLLLGVFRKETEK